MNILQVINSFRIIGGAERLLSDIATIMAQQHHIEVLVLQDSDSFLAKKIIESGIKIHSLGLKNAYNPLAIWKIRHFIKHNPQFDIIHVHLFPSLYWVALSTICIRRHLIWTEHNTTNKRRSKAWLQPFEKFIYSQYEMIICISTATMQEIKQWTQAKELDHRYCIIENGVDIDAFSKVRKRKLYDYTLIQVSRFSPAKDQDTVIRAVKLLPKNVHVLFVGDGERINICKQLSLELGLQDRVHFLGVRQDTAELFACADIAVQSSNWEGFGLVAVEAMATGLPVIASEVDGLKQVTEGAGLLFPRGDERMLAQLIKSLIDDKTLYNKISEKCIKRAKEYDISSMANKYLDIYKSILSK